MRGEALTAIGGHDRETVPLHVEWAPPKAKQKGLDWAKLTPPADDLTLGVDQTPLVVPPAPKCRNCGAVLVKNVCAACTELEEARRDAEFAQPKFTEITTADLDKVERDLGAALNAKLDQILTPGIVSNEPTSATSAPSLQFEWAQLLADTADSTDRTIVSARFLALASLEHLRLTAAGTPPAAAAPKEAKTPRPKRQPSTRGPGGSATRANTTEIVRLYQAGNTINEVSAATGHSKGTVRTHLLAAGVELRDDRHTKSGGGNKRVDPPELTERVRALYEDEHLSQMRIAERLRIGHKVVQGIMRRGGIVAREGQSGSGDTLTGLKDRLAALGVKSADVRVWAKAHGHEVSVRGVVPADVLTAFEDAHR